MHNFDVSFSLYPFGEVISGDQITFIWDLEIGKGRTMLIPNCMKGLGFTRLVNSLTSW